MNVISKTVTLLAAAFALTGCAAVTVPAKVGGSVVSTGVKTTGTVVQTGVKTTGTVVSAPFNGGDDD